MARYRKRRFYKRKTGRWSANIQEIGNLISAGPEDWFHTESIMSNPTQQPTYVSQTYTVKNVEINFTLEHEDQNVNGIYLEAITAYIMYVPQGMTVTKEYNLQHPEYIMAYKYLGSPVNEYNAQIQQAPIYIANGQNYQPFRVKTRLSRKLQTGDSVILFLKGNNQTQNNITCRLTGVIRWWTKAN